MSAPHRTIVGQGLAGTCLAWELWKRGAPFFLVDRERGGSSRVAAGLINPVTGKNFEPSARIAEFLPEAMEFYAEAETRLGLKLWHPLPVLRLADSEKEWEKMISKCALPAVGRWLAHGGAPVEAEGWTGALELTAWGLGTQGSRWPSLHHPSPPADRRPVFDPGSDRWKDAEGREEI